MKVLFALHGYPPELMGGTENTVRAQARALVARGHEVVVVAGSMNWKEHFETSEDTDTDPASGKSYPVYRLHRNDLYFDHWQKSASPKASRAFRDILRSEKPDLVHVQHWIRLSRDLVATAARERIPSVVTLHDLWTTCLLTFRVRPGADALCEENLGHSPCIRCAAEIPPKTPWVTAEAGAVAFVERMQEVNRELDLARAIVTPSRAHAGAIESFLNRGAGSLEADVIPPGRELDLGDSLGSERSSLEAPAVSGGKLVLGAWGHLDPIKGLDLVLRAIAELEDPSRVTLHLAGGEVNPDYARRLHELASGLDVHFHGPFEVARLGSHPVAEVHAMVSGSRAHESWGLVLDEAWHLGLPALLPNCGAFRDRLVEERGGLLYESSSVNSLSSAIARLLDDPELLGRLRTSIPPSSEIAPTLDQMVESLEAVYAKALAAGPPDAPEDQSLQDMVRARALEEWDKSLSRRSAVELGFEEAPS